MDRRNVLKWMGFSLAAVKALTGFWQMVLGQCKDFAEHYNGDGGNAKVVYLPGEGITGNSHFMFQELNNGVIADYIENWLKQINL